MLESKDLIHHQGSPERTLMPLKEKSKWMENVILKGSNDENAYLCVVQNTRKVAQSTRQETLGKRSVVIRSKFQWSIFRQKKCIVSPLRSYKPPRIQLSAKNLAEVCHTTVS